MKTTIQQTVVTFAETETLPTVEYYNLMAERVGWDYWQDNGMGNRQLLDETRKLDAAIRGVLKLSSAHDVRTALNVVGFFSDYTHFDLADDSRLGEEFEEFAAEMLEKLAEG